jgi:3-hydroxy-9,10-secoandrosta-1,3,5(10)-triene-9,17-dione monooxygenase reductase component
VTESFTQTEFRNALGSFATGVSIVTTLGKNGQKVGMTANSFNSVSLTPPLVLWSIDKSTNCFDDFIAADAFAVHILAADQQDLSNRFATTGEDRFGNIQCTDGLSGIPILPHYSACFECKAANQFDGGDHIIMTGEVVRFSDNQLDPLLFYRGSYHKL